MPRITRERDALALLERALEWSAEEREARVSEASSGDAALKARVYELLEGVGSEALIPDDPHRSFFHWITPPERIGPYRLTEQIGEGGMGVVFKGERDDGLFQQTVAIKLVRPGLMSPALADRFAEERRILARLAHPNIAQLFDGGVDPDGTSFIVMEYIEGQPITAYVDTHALALPEALRLFEQACEAVQTAHQQLVVHADIKPDNVLVTAGQRVKLLDFGIARLMDVDTMHTSVVDLLDPAPMTRAYAAPERLAGQPPTVASDVYALGAMLYQMLVGELPSRLVATEFVASSGKPVSLPAWIPPSRTVGLSAARVRQLSGDLDAIVLRALSEHPDARYPTVANLLDDLRAWRDDRPVSALSGAGPRYRAWKFWRRHRVTVALSSAFVALLIGATAVTQYQYRQAELARADADRRFGETRAMSKFMLFDLFDELSGVPGTLAARRNLAETAQRYLDELSSMERAPLDLRLETAEGYIRLGSIRGGHGRENLGDVTGFRDNYLRAEELLRGLLRETTDRADIWLAFGGLETDLAFQAMHVDNRLDVAEQALNEARDAVERARNLVPDDAKVADLQWVIANYRIDLLQWDNRLAEAIAAGEAAIALVDALPEEVRGAPVFPSRLAALFRRQGESLQTAGRPQEAVALHKRAVAAARDGIRTQQGSLRSLRTTSICEWALGRALLSAQDAPEALRHFDAALELSGRALTLEPANDQLQRTDMINASDRALALSALTRHDEARRAFASVLARARERVLAAPEDQSRVRDLAEQRKIAAEIEIAAGDRRSGCAGYAALLPELSKLRASGTMTAYDAQQLLADLERRIETDCARGS